MSEDRQRKPPIDLNQPQVPPGYVPYQPNMGYPPQYPPPYYPPPMAGGGLSYVPQKEEKKSGGGGGLGQMLMSIVVAVLISLFAMMQLGPMFSGVGGISETVKGLQASVAAHTTDMAALKTVQANILNSNYVKTETLGTYALKTEIPSSTTFVAKLEYDALSAKVKALEDWKATVGSIGGTTTPGTTPVVTPTGQITYTVQNPPAFGFWTLSTIQNISVRVFNNKSDARYVRPQITLTSYQGQVNVVIAPGPTATVISNSISQAPVVFTATAIPNVGACTQVLYYSSSGGVLNGQYLLGSGQAMDLLVQITVPISSGTGLWTLQVGGSDVSMITGY